MKTLRILLAAGLATGSVSSLAANDDESALINRSRKVYGLISQFITKNDGRLPESLEELAGAPVANKSLLASNVDRSKPGFKLLTPASKIAQIAKPNETRLVQSLDVTRSGKQVVVFVDGHVEWLPVEPAR